MSCVAGLCPASQLGHHIVTQGDAPVLALFDSVSGTPVQFLIDVDTVDADCHRVSGSRRSSSDD
jgi:hypothetical protein